MLSGEKPAQRPRSLVGSPFSLVRFVWEQSRSTGIFRVFRSRRAPYFSAVQTAWRRGKDFEPSVQFCRAKPRRIRKLQIAKPYQRISYQNRYQSFAISPVSIRHPFGHERRTPGDSVAKSGYFARPQAARLGSHVTACLGGSHKTESFSGGKNYLRHGFLIIFDYYARAFSAVVAPLPQANSGPVSVSLSEAPLTLAQSGQARFQIRRVLISKAGGAQTQVFGH